MMATERLYFADAYLQRFTAQVVARRAGPGGLAVALDQSAFYPEGGGQPGDRGTLNDVAVLDTQVEDGIVWHWLAAPLNNDNAVTGQLDWARRFDFMQQHHGQHLLSAAFAAVCGATTVAVHLGAEVATVDLDRADLTAAELAAAEDWTNAVIYQNLPVAARFVSPAELAALPLRKPPKVTEHVRVVSVPDVDYSACGGTHPRHTGEVGVVALGRTERRGATLRIEFRCGQRALCDYREKTALVAALAGEFSVAAAELPAAVARLRAAEQTQRKALDAARQELCGYTAQSLLAAAPLIGGVPVVCQALADYSTDELRAVAQRIAAAGGVALLGLRADKAQLVFARGAGLAPDMGALLRASAAVVGGRGGGRPELAQGGGPDLAQLDAALQTALDLVRAQLEQG